MKQPFLLTSRSRWTVAFRWCATTVLALAILGLVNAWASEFAIAVSPPRFELKVKPGERSRHVLEITNASAEATPLTIKTADWSLGKDNSVTFFDELQAGSCRPWVAVERRTLTVAGGRPYRFRFEVNVPPDAKPEECRLAIMLEGQQQVTKAQGGVDIPFSARVGVVIYLAIGGAEPILTIAGAEVQTINGKSTPVLLVKNSGTAHGRLGGFLSGTDASKNSLEFTASNSPILAGETRPIALAATRPGDPETAVDVKFPIIVTGKIEWGSGKSQNIEQRFAP